MAGTFTHWLVVQKAVEILAERFETGQLAALLVRHKHWVHIGAQGPDYPYEGFIRARTGTNWADLMHYDRTGDFTRVLGSCVHRALAPEAPWQRPDQDLLKAWYLGYISHVLADVIIHPVVQAIVGPYSENRREHGRCEMVQDSLLHSEIRGRPLAYDYWIKKLLLTPAGEELPDVIGSVWGEALSTLYRAQWIQGTPLVYDWHRHFLRATKVRQSPPALFRHIGEDFGLSYPFPGEIPQDEAVRFYERVALPDGVGVRHFREIFESATKEVAEKWAEASAELETAGSEALQLVFLRNWDLDTGVSSDHPDEGPTYWPV